MCDGMDTKEARGTHTADYGLRLLYQPVYLSILHMGKWEMVLSAIPLFKISHQFRPDRGCE